ncbi:ribosomal protein P1, partial [Alternaria alternata]
SEQAVAYAALILADESIAITPEKLQTLLKAAGLEDVEPIWTTLFANALKDKNVKEVLTAVTAAPAG